MKGWRDAAVGGGAISRRSENRPARAAFPASLSRLMRARLLAAAAAAAAALLIPAAPAVAGDPTMPLAEVRSGMQCKGYSVIHGTEISEFDVEVLDVVDGDPVVGDPRILVRVSGPAVDETGVGPGFSGSPIYCRDGAGVERVAGAISEGLGQYGNYVALATPIEDMLGVRPTAPPQARKATALLRSARPLATPLTVSGLSGRVRQAALAAARRARMPLFAAPAGPAVPYPAYPLNPGTAVGVGLSSGDVALAAIGTVTYRDADKLWAFGHLLEGVGKRSLPLLDAYVYSIIDNPIGVEGAMTYKLATAGRPVGTLTTDGLNAIAGRVGAPPATIPLTVFARNEANGRTRTLHVNVADERQLELGSALDQVGTFAASEAIANVLGAVPNQMTVSMCLRVSVKQRRKPLRFCQSYFDAFEPLSDLSTAFGLIDGFVYGRLGIRNVSIRMKVRAGVREAYILGAQAPLRVRRGKRVRIRLALQRSRAGRTRVSFPYRVPRSADRGPQILTIRGSGASNDLEGLEDLFFELLIGGFGSGGGSGPRTVGGLADRVAALGKPDGVRASFARKRRGPVVYSNDRLLIRGKAEIPMIVRGKKPRKRD